MRLRRILIPALVILSVSACSKRQDPEESLRGKSGGIEIVLTQDLSSAPVTRGAGAVPADEFSIEIYKAGGVRLYREPYAKAKGETIRLNAGAYRLVASHGDTLGCGFDRPYFLADQPFTVHGWKDNGGKPDRISALAKMANVGVRVEYGPNLMAGYPGCYTLVRHARYADKSLRFERDEQRTGYLPGGEVFLEVYASVSADALLFFRSETFTFAPNDRVTLHVDSKTGRPGALALTLQVDRSTETIVRQCQVPAAALPSAPPQFAFGGEIAHDFTARFIAGAPVLTQQADLGIFAAKGIFHVLLETNGAAGIPARLDLLHLSAAERAALETAGLAWRADEAARVANLNFARLVPSLFNNAVPDPATATFRSSVPTWTPCSVPIRYAVTDRKAASLRISFRSSATDSKDSRSLKLHTLSGDHDVHAGGVLYLDDVQLMYSE